MHVNHLQEVNWVGVEAQAECRELCMKCCLLHWPLCFVVPSMPFPLTNFLISMQNTNPDSFPEVNRAMPHLFSLNMKLKLEGCFHAVNLVGAQGRNATQNSIWEIYIAK